MFTNILYRIIYCWMYLHALLPFRALYILSDILYFPVYHIFRYRQKIVRNNLKNAFPDKDETERRKIEKEFYHHFCDYFVETMKVLHISDKEMQKRMIFKNTEAVDEITRSGNSCIVGLGHYGNWEWVPSITLAVDKESWTAQLYKPLRNKAFDRLFLKIRSRFGSTSIPKNDTLRTIVRQKRQGKKMVIGFIADQSPSRSNIHYWSTFLNQETAIFTGMERIAKQTGFAVYYLDITRTGRGYYTADCKYITHAPQDKPENYITERYTRLMEETILRNPSYWLWSHKRWKYSKKDFTA